MYHAVSRFIFVPMVLSLTLVGYVNANSAVPVTDLGNAVTDESVTRVKVSAIAQPSPAVHNANAQLFDIIELLQQELQSLRGQVEELTFNLKRLKDDQKQRYLDLDRRIVSLTSQPVVEPTSPQEIVVTSDVNSNAAVNVSAAVADPEAEKAAYKAAFSLIRERQYEAAITALNSFVVAYPQGILVGNAHYWLGEVYMVEGDVAAAAAAFEIVIKDFPVHRKVPDALYKAGVAYQKTGDLSKANALLQRVLHEYPDSSAARLAQEKIQ
ncbi:MAG TPA: tol-pal system protein YbgF [Oceanospirillaceae bacterium]|nr:tol-pal system protein YbgF [Oceanospirillaceae bacterium]